MAAPRKTRQAVRPPRTRRGPVAAVRGGGERFELAMRAINEGVYDWDVANSTIYYSEAVYSVLHMPRSVKTPAGWRARIHPDDLAAYDAAIVAHFKKKTRRFECDYRYRARDRTWRWARQHGIAIRDRRGRVVRVIGSTGDITELKRVELALAESRERYALATWAATEGIYEWNLATGTLFLSDRAKTFFGVKGAKLTPAAWNARVHRDDFPGYRAAIAAYFKGRTAQFEHEYRIRNSASGYAWVIDRAGAVRDESGRVVRMVGALSDITQRKLAEIELRRAHDDAAEALERQTATAEILKVIARSPSDIQPVLDTIVNSAARLCEAQHAVFYRMSSDGLRPEASHNVNEEYLAYRRLHPVPVSPRQVMGRVALTRKPVHVLDVLAEPDYLAPTAQKLGEYRTVLGVPVIREGELIGTLSVFRSEVRPFLDSQIQLIATFADQAVIAIENVRLFNETREALEQQRASAEVLASISGSMTDTQPVFEKIVMSLRRLFGTRFTVLQLLRGDMVEMPAVDGHGIEKLRELYPRPIDETTVGGRAMLAKQTLQFAPVIDNPATPPATVQFARDFGFNSVIFTPMIHEGEVIGAIGAAHSESRPFDERQIALIKTFADQAVIAIQNARLFNETKEALERQTATAEILKVIASSPSDVQPVFDAIAASARRLLDGGAALVARRSGDRLELAAYTSTSATADETLRKLFPAPITGQGHLGKAILTGAPVRISDMQTDESYSESFRAMARTRGLRGVVSVPMLREGEPIGVISVNRPVAGEFSDHQTNLLKTFADQAVIAIENVRLFNETKEALERQTATAEILKVIASSPSDVHPVFDAILQSAVNLCAAEIAAVFPYDGKLVHLGATYNWSEEALRYFSGVYPSPPSTALLSGRTVLGKSIVTIEDATTDEHYDPSSALTGHWRRMLGVPMLREGQPLGAIVVCWREPGQTPQRQVDLLQTFADQAVIAIENVRLFNETREALERQTATAEILKVMSSSPTDVQPVLDAIASSAARLFEPCNAAIVMREGDLLQLRARVGPQVSEATRTELDKIYPIPFDPDRSNSARAIVERRTIVFSSSETVPTGDIARSIARAGNFRSAVTVPFIRDGEGIGTIALLHPDAGFSLNDNQLSLIQTFADQAVIAIENVRLFNETREALERQTATAEILRVISGSPGDVHPVFDAIMESAMHLCDAHLGTVGLYDGKNYQHVAQRGGSPEYVKWLLSGPFATDPAHTIGQMVAEMRPVHVPDYRDLPEYRERNPRAVATAELGGARTFLAVPMLKDGRVVGGITIRRTEVRPFTQRQIDLVSTFASQAVIAIDNVRLFNETREALERQTATAEILKVIAGSPSDVQPVFDVIAERATQLCDGKISFVFMFDGDWIRLVAVFGMVPEGVEAVRKVFPMRPGGHSVAARTIRDGTVVHDPDVLADPEYLFADTSKVGGFRSVLGVPMLRDGRIVGGIAVAREEVGHFRDKQVELLKTFADQAVIAIENVRLFNETKEALERQTATGEILGSMSGSMTDTNPVFDAIVRNTMRLFSTQFTAVFLLRDSRIEVAAYKGEPGFDGILKAYPRPLDDQVIIGKAMLTRKAHQLSNISSNPDSPPATVELARRFGYESIIAAPMIRGGVVIGGIASARQNPAAFDEKQVALLQSFANQAVIAIENVRLFNETKESLERQTATAEVLKVIASSPSDVQPVFEAIVQAAARLFGRDARIRLMESGQLVLRARSEQDATDAVPPEPLVPIDRDTNSGRIVLEGKPVQVADTEAPDAPAYALSRRGRLGYRAIAGAPLMRDKEVVGVINVTASQPGALSERQMSLLQTFADQAVIAIENVRLFNETKEALERQTATAEILRVISQSPTDTRPVFDAIVKSGIRLFAGDEVVIGIVDGGELRAEAAAGAGVSPIGVRVPISQGSAGGIAILERRVVNICDTEAPDAPPHARDNGRRLGVRSMTHAPMFREGEAIGTILVMRRDPGGLDDKQIALLKTFADQAVIAIENVRLFKELQSRTDALTKSVGQLTALGEVGQAISSTLDLETVLKTIVSRAVQLTGLNGGSIYEFDERSRDFHLRAAENMPEELAEVYRRMPIRLGEGIVGSAAERREPLQVPDIQDPSYQTRYRELLIRQGYRAILAVPLLREEQIIGALTVSRSEPGAFVPEVVELLKTFATQSAMAIQNARLFREIAEKGRQLEVASQHKSNFLASMSHELRTPLNAILGFNEMILGQVYGEVPADMQEPLADIQASGKHLLRLINNVLDLAKIEAGRMELSLQDYSVHDTVASVHATLRPLAAEKGLEFLANVPNDVPLAYGDGGRMAQCLMNLAGNSLKFTKAGKVEISVELKAELLVYKVSDTGIGIPPDKIGSLFTEFKQTDATIASEYGGTGLGLSISRKFVEMHGGRIWVESELGKGSAFIIEVPLRVKTS